MKRKKYDFFVYIVSFFLLVIISYFMTSLTRDEIWNYGFSYNMAHGMIPYKDFNMVVGPFYNFLIAIFLPLFKNHIFFFFFLNGLLFSLFLIPISRKIGNSYLYLIFFLGILPIVFNYNTFVAFLCIFILILEENSSKYQPWMIGLLLSFIFMTKQNIGILFLIVTLFTSKNKKEIFVSFLIPCLIFFVILLYQENLFNYIDFCYFGLGNFLDNFSCSIPFLLIEILILLLLGRKFLLTKDSKLLYLIFFQTMAFPIVDNNHVFIGLLPVLYYVLSTYEKRNYLIIGKRLLVVSFIVVFLKGFPFTYTRVDSFISYRRVNPGFDSYFLNITNYVKQKEKEGHVYLLMSNAYLIRLALLETPSFYDLINQGNLGSHKEKYLTQIEKTCQKEKCLFILDSDYFSEKQEKPNDLAFKGFILENYQYLETLPSKDQVYIN